MEGYYRFPLRFDEIFQKRDLQKCALVESIARNIQLLVTTAWGENKLDEQYGTFFWENDFDILTTNAKRREIIIHSVLFAIQQYEKRLQKVQVEVAVKQTEVINEKEENRLKRKIEIVVSGTIKKNNQPFKYQTGFFIGPFAVE